MPWWMPWSCSVRIISRPGAVADVGQPRVAVAAEVALQDAAVRRPVEHRAPGLELAHAVGRFLGVQLGHAPVVDVLAAAHRVGEVHLPAVAIVDVGQRGRHAAFGHDRVRLARAATCRSGRPMTPAAEASIAARSPAPPAPITRTS